MKTKAFVLVLFALCRADTGVERRVCPVNVNKATLQQLEKVPGLGPARARMIVRVRERNGPFRRVEELKAIPRLSEKAFQKLRKHVSVADCESKPNPQKVARE